MRIAIISDIHSNQEALLAVLARIKELPVDVVYCLGDLVGYNADPDACMDMVLARAKETVRGNHDKAVAGFMSLDWFNTEAREAALWTRQAVKPENLEKLKRLREGPHDVGEGILICHGTPYDEDAYLMDSRSIAESYHCLDAKYNGIRFCLHGHTHHPLVVSRRKGAGAPRVHRGQEQTDLDGETVYLINPGSIGQPRDGIALASFGILDTRRMVYKNIRVRYAVQETQRKVQKAGLPPGLARRLAEGR